MDAVETYVEISDRERALEPADLEKPLRAADLAGALGGAAVLDAGSGQGWHALVLAGRFTVLAVDANRRVLAEAARRGRAWAAHSRLRFRRARLEDHVLPESSFDFAISLNTSIGYGTRDNDGLALEGIARGLQPGAKLVLETASATGAAEAVPEERWLGDARVVSVPAFEPSTCRIREIQRATFADGRTGTFDYTIRAYDPTELQGLALEAGFSQVTVAGGLDGRRWQDSDPVVLLARR